MAKTKGARAVLPREEWPYEVPENWVWTQGKNIFKPMETKKPSGEYFFYIDIETIDNKNQTVQLPKRVATVEAPSRANRKIQTGDTIFSLVRPYLRNIAYINEDLSKCIASTGFYVCRPIGKIDSRYVYWLMTSDYTVMGLNQYMKGDNSPSIRNSDIEEFCFPLPPLPEQQRIVARIESLFSKLDAAAGKIRAAFDQFPIRKAAVLHKAFTGELTKEWREDNGVGMENWKHKKFRELGDTRLGKMLDKAKNIGSTIQYLRNVNVRWFGFSFDDVLTILATKEEQEKLSIKDGDLLICEGGEPGRCAVWNLGGNAFIYQKALHRFRPSPENSSQFVAYYLYYMSTSGKLATYFTGTTIKHLTGKALAILPVCVPTLSEQKEIVRILDAIFEREQKAKEAAEHLLEQIALTKKSILARAFRGALGTNDPAEESAAAALSG